MENNKADAGRDGRPRLARPNSQARAGTGKTHFPCSADHEQGWQLYLVDRYSALCDDHTYIHTYQTTHVSYYRLYCRVLALQQYFQFLSWVCVFFLFFSLSFCFFGCFFFYCTLLYCTLDRDYKLPGTCLVHSWLSWWYLFLK